MKTNEIFLSHNSVAWNLIKKYEFPYEVLPNIKNYIIELGKTLDSDYELCGENVWIHKSANVSKSAEIEGPCIIDANAEIRSAYIRGNVVIGKNCVLGNSCEIKNSILFDNVKIPHLSYVGDSILGFSSHLGAGVIISNTRIDGENIKVNNIKTNLKKVGAFIGDNVEIGCNSVINPGSIIGPNTIVYPLTSFRGVALSGMIIKGMNNIIKKS